MISSTVIYKDESYAILVTRDGIERLCVQLVSYIPRQLPNSEDELEEHLSAKVLDTAMVAVCIGDVVSPHLKTNLASAISDMQKKLALRRHIEEHIEGALKDYVGTPR